MSRWPLKFFSISSKAFWTLDSLVMSILTQRILGIGLLAKGVAERRTGMTEVRSERAPIAMGRGAGAGEREGGGVAEAFGGADYEDGFVGEVEFLGVDGRVEGAVEGGSEVVAWSRVREWEVRRERMGMDYLERRKSSRGLLVEALTGIGFGVGYQVGSVSEVEYEANWTWLQSLHAAMRCSDIGWTSHGVGDHFPALLVRVIYL